MDTEYDEPPFIHNSAGERANAYMVVESNRMVPILVALAAMALLVAGLALGIGFWSLSYADKARMESRILQVKVEGFENALHAKGINPNPHLPGE